MPGWSLHVLCCTHLHAKTWGREKRKCVLFHLENWETFARAGKEAELQINRNRTKKHAENVDNIFKEQTGDGKLSKTELIVI